MEKIIFECSIQQALLSSVFKGCQGRMEDYNKNLDFYKGNKLFLENGIHSKNFKIMKNHYCYIE